MPKLARNSATLILPALLAIGCGRMDVTARISATTTGTTSSDIYSVALRRGDAESTNELKVRTFVGDIPGRTVRNPAAQLKITITGQPNDLAETYHFVAFATDFASATGGVSGDRSYVTNRIGSVFHLHMRKGDNTVEATTNGSFHLGTALIAYQKPDDRVIPWRIDSSATNCVPAGSGDCLDLETITRSLLTTIATGVEGAVADHVPFGSVSRHQLHYVPHAQHDGIEAAGRRARGFGLIYHARIEVPGGGFEVFVPISFLFLDDVQSYRLVIDPMTQFGQLGAPENVNRVFVKADGIVGIAEGFVRDQIVAALGSISLPVLESGVEFEQVVLLAFTTIAGRAHLQGQPPRVSPRYEAILLPDEERTDHVFSSNVLWEQLAGQAPREVRRVKLVFLE
jgi:hypothetical protein